MQITWRETFFNEKLSKIKNLKFMKEKTFSITKAEEHPLGFWSQIILMSFRGCSEMINFGD